MTGAAYLGAGQVAHHEVGVFESVVVVVVVTRGGGALGAKGSPAGAAAVVLGVERVHDDGLGALDFTAAERAARPLALRLLRHTEEAMTSRRFVFYTSSRICACCMLHYLLHTWNSGEKKTMTE